MNLTIQHTQPAVALSLTITRPGRETQVLPLLRLTGLLLWLAGLLHLSRQLRRDWLELRLALLSLAQALAMVARLYRDQFAILGLVLSLSLNEVRR